MTDLLKPGAGLIFMKVGTHAQEPLREIIARKRKEIEDAGYALWGYGGNTCHPLHQVQPFARDYIARDGKIYLVMQPMVSRHFATPLRATASSADGATWNEIPAEINVRGSRHAIVIRTLEERDFELPLAHTRVASGPTEGRRGDLYISGHVDKGCLEVTDEDPEDDAPRHGTVHIGLVAEIVEPYAVLLR